MLFKMEVAMYDDWTLKIGIHAWKMKLEIVFNSNYSKARLFAFKQYMAIVATLYITSEDFEKCQPLGRV